MRFFKKFKKKKEEKEKIPEVKKPTELEELCGNDKDVYEALKDTMFLDPRKVGIALEEAEKKAKESERAGDSNRARINYQIALGLAIWQGDVKGVIKFAQKLQKLLNREYPILKIPEKAVAKAKEYYQKYLKEEEKK